MTMRFEDGSEAQGRSMNISLGGMFVATEALRPVGTTFAVEFRLTEGGRLIQGQGRVLWTREEAESEDYPRGVGVRFLELTPGSRELIFEVVDQHVRESDAADADSSADRQREAPPPVVGSLSLEEMPEALDEVHPATLDAAIEEAVDREMDGGLHGSAPPAELTPSERTADDPAEGLARVLGDEAPVTPADLAGPPSATEGEKASPPMAETAAWAFPAEAGDPGAEGLSAGDGESERPVAPFVFDDAPPTPLKDPADSEGGASGTDGPAGEAEPVAPAPTTPFGDPGFGAPHGTPRSAAEVPEGFLSGEANTEGTEVLGSVDGDVEDKVEHKEVPGGDDSFMSDPQSDREPWEDWHEDDQPPPPWYRTFRLPVLVAMLLVALALTWWIAKGRSDGAGDTVVTTAENAGMQGTIQNSAADELPDDEVIDVAADPNDSAEVQAREGSLAEPPGDAAAEPSAANDTEVQAAPAAPMTSPEPTTPTAPATPSEPARTVTGITWERQGSETVILLQGDGAFTEGTVRQSRLGGANPRLLVRLIGIEQPFADGTVAVDSGDVTRVRTGHHVEKNPDELHVVVDLADPAVELAAIEPLGDRLRLRFRRP